MRHWETNLTRIGQRIPPLRSRRAPHLRWLVGGRRSAGITQGANHMQLESTLRGLNPDAYEYDDC